MMTKMFTSVKIVISENAGSKGDFCLGPFLFLAILIDCREGRRGCWGRSLSLAKLLAGMPCQLKVLSEASLPNRGKRTINFSRVNY